MTISITVGFLTRVRKGLGTFKKWPPGLQSVPGSPITWKKRELGLCEALFCVFFMEGAAGWKCHPACLNPE